MYNTNDMTNDKTNAKTMKMLIIPKKILLVSEDGTQEINLLEAQKYCGEQNLVDALHKGIDCTLEDTLEFQNTINIKF